MQKRNQKATYTIGLLLVIPTRASVSKSLKLL